MDTLTIKAKDGTTTSTAWWDRVRACGRDVVLEKDREGESPVVLVVATLSSVGLARAFASEIAPHVPRNRRARAVQNGRREP